MPEKLKSSSLFPAIKEKARQLRRLSSCGVVAASTIFTHGAPLMPYTQEVGPPQTAQASSSISSPEAQAATLIRSGIIFEDPRRKHKHKKKHDEALHITADSIERSLPQNQYIYENICAAPKKYKMPTQQQIQAYVDWQINLKYGPNQAQYVDNIIQHESGWRLCIFNTGGSGACGLGQFLDCWGTFHGNMSLYKQVIAIEDYIDSRYQDSPADAWNFWYYNRWW